MIWKEKFLKYFIQDNSEAVGKAFELKRSNIPRYLYRYRSLDTIEKYDKVINEIKKGTIYLANPNEFNDPFDSKSVINKINLNELLNKKKKIKEKFSLVFSQIKLDEIFNSHNWMTKLLYEIAKNNDVKYFGVNGIKENAPLENAINFNRAINKLSHERCRVACFTEDYKNIPMWTHYSSGYKGICLEIVYFPSFM